MSDFLKSPMSTRRITNTLIGRLVAFLLVLIWVASMCLGDGLYFNLLPIYMGLVGVSCLMLIAWVQRVKCVRIPQLFWVSLILWIAYLIRADFSYAVVDGMSDYSLLLLCPLFYLAGVYYGQSNSSGRGIAWVLLFALMLNAVAWVFMRQDGAQLEWLGRSVRCFAGGNTLNTSLFIYKNFAGVFFFVGGFALMARLLWLETRNAEAYVHALCGFVAVVISFFCNTRAPYFLLPLALVGAWGIWLALRLSNHQKSSWFDWLIGFALLLALGVACYDFFFGHYLADLLKSFNSHERFNIWQEIMRRLAAAPAWGYGAGASQWEILPYYNEWQRPNFAHNEYLQVWMDYGFLGLLGMLFILLVHLGQAALSFVSEYIDHARRVQLSLCVFILALIAFYAYHDFVWHHPSYVALSAFLCGVMISPIPRLKTKGGLWRKLGFGRRWASDSKARLEPVRAQKGLGVTALVMLGVTWIIVAMLSIIEIYPLWEANQKYGQLCAQGAPAAERSVLLRENLKRFPSFEILSEYLYTNGREKVDLREYYGLIDSISYQVLAHNPKDLHTLVIRADVLGRLGRCDEAEMLMRDSYVQGGQPSNMQCSWAAYYGFNLLRWANQSLKEGKPEQAHSMLQYALNMSSHTTLYPDTLWRGGEKFWVERRHMPEMREFLKQSKADLRLLQSLEIPMDHSWKEPMRAGGQAALYQVFGEKMKEK